MEEAQKMVQSVGIGKAFKEEKSVKSDKKKPTKMIEVDGKQVLVTDED